MSIDISFSAVICDTQKIFPVIEAVAEQQALSFHREQNWIGIHFCPMGELLFEIENNHLFRGECQTNLCGPGFHAAVAAFLMQVEQMIGFQFDVQDETGYYYHRNFVKLQHYFYGWLEHIIEICVQQFEQEHLSFYICWDLYQYRPYQLDGYLITPFGSWEIPKLISWVEQEGIIPFANAFFLWSNQEQDGRYYRNVALHMLWENCCFVPAERAEQDYCLQEQILDLLEKAMEQNPGLPIPKEDYLLLCHYHLREPQVRSNIPNLETDIPIGYRKGFVTWTLGSLQYTLPGSFLMEEEENAILWYDNDATSWHTVRITGWETENEEAIFSEKAFAAFGAADIKTIAIEDGYCRFCFAGAAEEQEAMFYQSIGQIICGKQTFFITVSYQSETEQQWAFDFFYNLKAEMPQEMIAKTIGTNEAGNLLEADMEACKQ